MIGPAGFMKSPKTREDESSQDDLLCADGRRHWWAGMSWKHKNGIHTQKQRCDLCGEWRTVRLHGDICDN